MFHTAFQLYSVSQSISQPKKTPDKWNQYYIILGKWLRTFPQKSEMDAKLLQGIPSPWKNWT